MILRMSFCSLLFTLRNVTNCYQGLHLFSSAPPLPEEVTSSDVSTIFLSVLSLLLMWQKWKWQRQTLPPVCLWDPLYQKLGCWWKIGYQQWLWCKQLCWCSCYRMQFYPWQFSQFFYVYVPSVQQCAGSLWAAGPLFPVLWFLPWGILHHLCPGHPQPCFSSTHHCHMELWKPGHDATVSATHPERFVQWFPHSVHILTQLLKLKVFTFLYW